jgi:hypothetical protein
MRSAASWSPKSFSNRRALDLRWINPANRFLVLFLDIGAGTLLPQSNAPALWQILSFDRCELEAGKYRSQLFIFESRFQQTSSYPKRRPNTDCRSQPTRWILGAGTVFI